MKDDKTKRIVFAPIVLPVGIMLSVIGGPFFMYLLLKNRGGVGHWAVF